MIMKIFSLENDIIFSEECINVLQIQDKKLFANVINSLNDNINGIQNTKERIIILDNDTEIKMEKEALMVIDLFNIDFNQKKIQSALYNKIEKIYKQEFERMSEFQTLFQKLQLNVLDVFNEFPFEFNYKDSIGIQEYLKLLGLKISNNKGEIIDKIFSLIDAVEYLSVAKLLIFVNLKLYLSDDELNEIYKYAMYKKVNILLIETGEEKEPIKNEKILFVDSDYDTTKYNNSLLYQTPCYSIENFYTSEKAFSKMLNREFGINTTEKDFSKCCSDYSKRQQEFHNSTIYINSWLACQRLHEEGIEENHKIVLSDFKISKLFSEIAIDSIVSKGEINREKIEELFPDSKKMEECEIEKKIEYLKKIIDSLKAKNKTGGYFSQKYTSVHIDPNINILSALADYADTPQCLIDFLKQYQVA